MPRKINYPSYQHGGPTDDPERLYKMYLSALEDIDREISNYGTINMDDVYDFPSSPGAASAINREAGLERLFDQKRDLEGSLRRQGKLLGYGGSKYRDGTMGSGRFPGMSAIREEGAGRITDPSRMLGPGSDYPGTWSAASLDDDLLDPVITGFDLEDELDRVRQKSNRPQPRLRQPVIENPFDLPGRHNTPAGILRKLMRGKGLKGLLMAGAATAASPLAALADVLISPGQLGSGDLPEEDFLTDEQKTRYYQELMKPGRDLGLTPQFPLAGGGEEEQRGMLERLLGGWDNRLGGGEEQAREQHEARERLREIQTEQRRQEIFREMERQRRERRETVGRASGGIVGLQEGGPAPYMSQVTSTGVPQQTAQQWANLTDRITAEGQRGYQQYGGQRLAGFTQPEAAAMAGKVAYGQGVGPMGTRQAASTMGQAGQMLGSAYKGIGGLQPQYAQMAGQFGGAAQGALGQAQAGAQGMQDLSARAQLQGQLAGAGMRQTGTAAQAEQQALGAGQAAAGQAGQAQMTGLGQQMGTAGQAALGAQQGYATGMTGLGAQAGLQGQAGQAQFGALGTAAGQLGQTAMGQMGQTGQQSQQQAQQAAQRMRDIGGQAPQLQKGADMSDYMSQYTKGVTDPQLQQLMEFQRMQGQELGSQAAQAGAFGGLRQGVQASTQAQEASQQAADIIGQGQQKAFESAQQAFQADRAAQQQAQQTGLSAEQQAAATQAGAQGQALAAQQAGVGAAQAGGAQQLQAAQQGQAAGQAGLSAQMQAQQQAAGMADVGAGRQMQGIQGQGGLTAQGIGMGQQGLAAQQGAAAQGAQFGLQGQQQGFQAAQAGTQLGLAGLQQAGQLGQQGYGTMGQLMGQQQGAIGAQGQGFGQMGQLGGQMGQLGGQQMQLGQQQQQQQFERLRQMEAAGEKQRQLQQQSLGMGYQDWQNQMDQERKNIGWQQSAMSGLPYQGMVTQSRFQPQTGPGASALATGIGAMGLWNQYNRNQQQQGPQPQSANASWGGGFNKQNTNQNMQTAQTPIGTNQPIGTPNINRATL